MMNAIFYLFKSAIYTVLTNPKKFVNTKNKFSRNHKFKFQDIIKFFLFNKGSSNQDDLDDFLKDKFDEVELELTRQNLSQQQTFIEPLVFKEISKEYLNNINYTVNNSLLKTFNGFFLIARDGSNFEILTLKKLENNLE